jgi:Tfp pilus assembly protein PilF
MIFRPEAFLALAFAALALAGCAADAGEDAAAGLAAGDPAVRRLLTEADAAMAAGALADAGAKLDEARARAPERPDLWLAIARLRLRGGEHLTAIAAADRALAIAPGHAPALLLRALTVRDAHGAAEARVWFEAARKADPDNPDILAEYAATLGDSGEGGAMLAMVRNLAEAAPGDPRAAYLQAVLAARGGQFTIARSLLSRSGMAARGVPAAMLLDAVISLEEGNADSAAATLEGLAARQPANSRVRELLARALLVGGREAEVIARFGAEAEGAEASPYLVMLVARAHERLGDRSAAAPLLARAYGGAMQAPVILAAREGLPRPTAAMRRVLAGGSASVARDQALALREGFPASADLAVLAGDALLGAGDPRAALADYARASRYRRPWPLTRKLVWSFERAGEAAAADHLLARHADGDRSNADAFVVLAERRAARGDWKRAALLLDHAAVLGAGHDPGLLALRLRAAREAKASADEQRLAARLAELRPVPFAPR